MLSANCLDLGQEPKAKYIFLIMSCDVSYMWNLKRNDTNELIYLAETDSQTYSYPGWGTGIVKEFGMDMYTLLYLKWITNRTYCLTGNSAQCYVAAWVRGEFGGE